MYDIYFFLFGNSELGGLNRDLKTLTFNFKVKKSYISPRKIMLICSARSYRITPNSTINTVFENKLFSIKPVLGYSGYRQRWSETWQKTLVLLLEHFGFVDNPFGLGTFLTILIQNSFFHVTKFEKNALKIGYGTEKFCSICVE